MKYRGGSREGCRECPPPPLPERAPDNWYSAKYVDMYDICILGSSHHVIA